MKRKADRRLASPPRAPLTTPPQRPWTIFAFAAILAALPLLPSHPLSFLPPALYWPTYLGAAAWVSWRAACSLGWRGLPRRLAAILAEVVALVLVLGSYVLLKLPGLHSSGTDDNIYFYMAVRLGEGAIPYRDFFFSHPPMHLLIPALIFKLAGFSVGTAKLIPAVAQGLAGVFLYLSVRRASQALAAVVLLLHLTAYQVLMGSTDMNGENLMSAFLMSALFCVVSGRYVFSGVLAAGAVSCGLYALAGVAAIAIVSAASSGRSLSRWACGFGAALLVINLPFVLLGGYGYFEGVIAYHLAKPIKDSNKWPVFTSLNPFSIGRALFHNLGVWLRSDEFAKSLYYHAPAYVATGVAVGQILGRALKSWLFPESSSLGQKAAGNPRPWAAVLTFRDMPSPTPEGLVKVGVLAVVLFTFQWAALNEVYDFYQVPMMAFLALPAGYTLWRVCDQAKIGAGWRGLATSFAALGVFWLHVPWAASLGEKLWPEEAKRRGEVVTYDWRDPEILDGPAKLTRTLFFSDSRRKGEVTPYYRHYLWNKRLAFSTARQIAEYVRSTTTPEETITGASTLTPLVALLAGRRMAGDEADTNTKRFKSGVLTRTAFFTRVCSDRVRYILSAARSYFHEPFMKQDPVIQEFFTPDRVFVEPQLLHFRDFPITLYRRVDRPGLPDGFVCEAR